MSWEIRQGHVLDVLRAMPTESVQCVVTSPPYCGLRSYKTEPQVWGGTQHRHRWGDEMVGDTREFGAGLDKWQADPQPTPEPKPHIKISQGVLCGECGAWRVSKVTGKKLPPKMQIREFE